MAKKKLRLKMSVKRKLMIVLGCLSLVTMVVGYQIIFNSHFEQELKEFPEDEKSSDDEKDIKPVQNEEDVNKGNDPYDIDVFAVGNSDTYSSFNPFQLWHEQGITSFVAAGPKQNMKLSYYVLKKLLTVKKPKLIILETGNFFEKREDLEGEGYKYTAMRYIYPLFEKTSEWENIKKESYFQEPYLKKRVEVSKGYYFNQKVVSNTDGFSYMKKTSKREKFPTITNIYLPKIMELLKENNIPVLFVCFPTATTGSYARHNMVSDYAKENNIPFIDFNVDQYDTGFDWSTDSRDGGNHLNYSGAFKMTKYVGEYLAQNYHFSDKRENIKFKAWNHDYQEFLKRIK